MVHIDEPMVTLTMKGLEAVRVDAENKKGDMPGHIVFPSQRLVRMPAVPHSGCITLDYALSPNESSIPPKAAVRRQRATK